jgi:hypothetical protein
LVLKNNPFCPFITPNFLARKPQKIWLNTFNSSKFNVQESSPNPLHFAYPPVINHGTLKSPTKTDDFPNQNLYVMPGFPRFSQDLPIVFPLKPSFSGRQKLCVIMLPALPGGLPWWHPISTKWWQLGGAEICRKPLYSMVKQWKTWKDM